MVVSVEPEPCVVAAPKVSVVVHLLEVAQTSVGGKAAQVELLQAELGRRQAAVEAGEGGGQAFFGGDAATDHCQKVTLEEKKTPELLLLLLLLLLHTVVHYLLVVLGNAFCGLRSDFMPFFGNGLRLFGAGEVKDGVEDDGSLHLHAPVQKVRREVAADEL